MDCFLTLYNSLVFEVLKALSKHLMNEASQQCLWYFSCCKWGIDAEICTDLLTQMVKGCISCHMARHLAHKILRCSVISLPWSPGRGSAEVSGFDPRGRQSFAVVWGLIIFGFTLGLVLICTHWLFCSIILLLRHITLSLICVCTGTGSVADVGHVRVEVIFAAGPCCLDFSVGRLGAAEDVA